MQDSLAGRMAEDLDQRELRQLAAYCYQRKFNSDPKFRAYCENYLENAIGNGFTYGQLIDNDYCDWDDNF